MKNAASHPLADVTARLHAAFGMQSDDGVLTDAVHSFVDAARAQDWPIERMIIEIKRIAEVVNGPLYRLDPFDRADGQRQPDRAVTSCVEHYYQY